MDVALAFLPWKWIWSLQMNMKEKIGVLVAMTMGVLSVRTEPSKVEFLLTFSQQCRGCGCCKVDNDSRDQRG